MPFQGSKTTVKMWRYKQFKAREYFRKEMYARTRARLSLDPVFSILCY